MGDRHPNHENIAPAAEGAVTTVEVAPADRRIQLLEAQCEQLRQENRELDEQVKQLVKAEQRLFRYQKELDRQLTRIHAINEFALEASSVLAPRQILRCALECLFRVLAVDQGLAFLTDDMGLFEPAVAFDTEGEGEDRLQQAEHWPAIVLGQRLPTEACVLTRSELPTSRPWAVPFVSMLQRLYGDTREHAGRRIEPLIVILPLVGKHSADSLGLLVVSKRDPSAVSFHDKLPDDGDMPFLNLLTGHVTSTLESAMLHERVAHFAAEMEGRVAERTEALLVLNRDLEASLTELRETQGQLFQAGKMAAIGTLVAGLSHELNTPLGVILGYAQTLVQHVGEDSELQPALVAIERQAKRANALVHSLLDFSRSRPPTREPVTPESILDRVIALVRSQARCDNVVLTIDAPEERLPLLFANPTEIESALLNLVNNAIDAVAAHGEVHVHLGRQDYDGKPGIIFEVTDSGPGIAEDTLPWVFDPFFTTKPVGKGTGLGLALTRRIVRAHDGSLDLETRRDAGTTFSVWLPTAEHIIGPVPVIEE